MPVKLNSTGSSAVQMLSVVLFREAKRRIERRRLARSGGARDEQHAVGPIDGVLEPLQRLRVESELLHVELQVGLVEEPEHGLLAEERGQHRDAVVHLAALAELELDAAVLWQTTLGDVQLAHDLETGQDGVLELLRRTNHFIEHAVGCDTERGSPSRKARREYRTRPS